jgi:hypothetical protein
MKIVTFRMIICNLLKKDFSQFGGSYRVWANQNNFEASEAFLCGDSRSREDGESEQIFSRKLCVLFKRCAEEDFIFQDN